ncbi:acyltransferase family protein [Rubrolithibacter danxiaensis]|uniref:acyltransferase family protein n=1 Tax=Rubrolithibacter danxiaensis TaxID=3390805 RepID=UPI003BF886EE
MNSATEPLTSAPIINPALKPKRIVSVDAYRGFVMLLMMAEVLSFRNISEALPESSFWRFLYFHQDHAQWFGCSLHDLIQPSFTFLVGVALPFSLASRLARGADKPSLFKHAVIRSLILILLGIFLRSMYAKQTYFTFEDTLTQIGLGYTFLFILGFYSERVQLIALISILLAYWAAFALYPLPDSSFNYSAAGVTANWEHNFNGFAAHWNKNTNLAWAFDKWFLNLFPREHTFMFNEGGYSTLSFIPTLGTMILGLFAGNVLKSQIDIYQKIKRFILIGSSLLLLGFILHISGINPIVKRIWTPAWTIFSGGWCFLLLALFYWLIDAKHYQKWSFPLMVIGINSIAAYVIAHTLPSFIVSSFSTHFGQNFDKILGNAYTTLISGGVVLLIEFWILYWMYKRKLFIKI